MNSPSPRTEHECLVSLSDLLQEKKKIMVILRGLPGSGKSYLAKRINSHLGGYIASADNYFMRSGEYHYEYDKLESAHLDCQNKVKIRAREHISPIIVDNTNLESWEMIPYVKIAVEFGYYVHLLEPVTEWKYTPKVCHRYNRHNIPLDKIARMNEKFERNITTERLLRMYQDKYRLLSSDYMTSYQNAPQPNHVPNHADFSQSNQSVGVTRSAESHRPQTELTTRSNGFVSSTIRSAIRNFSSATEWQIPFYPTGGTSSAQPTANSFNSTVICDSSCQTYSPPGSGDSPLSNDFGETSMHIRSATLRRAITSDRSTETRSNPANHSLSSRDEQLLLLIEKFPDVEQETLIDIIEVCNGNIEYAMNVLSSDSCDFVPSDDSIIMIDDASPENATTSNFDLPDSNESRDKTFTLEIPASFALELEEEFGAFPSDSAYFNRSLTVPRNLAKQLYEIWKKQLQPPKDNAPALKPPAGEFEEQMQLEEALKQSRACAHTPVDSELTELYRKYPGCAEEILDQFYFENNRDLGKTIAAVDEQTRLASASLSSEDHWSKAAKKAPTSSNDCDINGTGDYFIVEENEFRELRNDLLERRKRLFDQKMNQKDPKTAQYYSEEIHKVNREYQKLINAYVKFRGQTFTEMKTLDLHGSTIKEGAQLLKSFVANKQKEINEKFIPHVDLEIITGWGLHSPTMRGQLMNSMTQVAKQCGLQIKSRNKGSFVIRLHRNP